MLAVASLGSVGGCSPIEQHPGSCECSHNRTARPAHKLPACEPTAFCNGDGSLEADDAGTAQRVSIVIVLQHNASRVRYWYQADPFRSYLNAMRLVVRLALSLADVGTRYPVHLLVSGERHRGFEEQLVRRTSVRLLWADPSRYSIKVPKWASPFHHGSFAKLAVLGLTQFRRIVVLDQDTVVFRNIDALARVPAPAFAYRFKCWRPVAPIWEINSGVMVLRPSERLHRRMRALLNTPGTVLDDDGRRGPNYTLAHVFVPSDPGDQSVWRSFYSSVHELPAGFNAVKKAHWRHDSDWFNVSILHDVDVHRRRRLPRNGLDQRYRNLTDRAWRLTAEMAAALGVSDRCGKGRGARAADDPCPAG